jgi:hypothetical protein
MFKKRYFSINNGFKTSFCFWIFLILGILFSIIYVFFRIFTFFNGENSSGFALELFKFSQTNIFNSILPFSIIFYAVAIIFYFFNCQFIKLAKIADEIENNKDINESEKIENMDKNN